MSRHPSELPSLFASGYCSIWIEAASQPQPLCPALCSKTSFFKDHMVEVSPICLHMGRRECSPGFVPA